MKLYYGNEKRIAARDTLIRLGFFIPFKDLDLYHGRNSKQGEPKWEVDPHYDNSDNKTGNDNVNKVPALNTGTLDVAKKFAQKRADQEGGTAQVVPIACRDPYAVIINGHFNFDKLDEKGKQDYKDALNTLTPAGVSQYAPTSFEKRDKFIPTLEKVSGQMQNLKKYLTQNDLAELIEQQSLDPELATSITGTQNAMVFLQNYPMKVTTGYYKNKSSIKLNRGEPNTPEFHYPIESRAIATWMEGNHVIGMLDEFESATLNGETIDNYLLFDLSKVGTRETINAKRENSEKHFRDIGGVLSALSTNPKAFDPMDQHPFDIVEKANKFQGVMDRDAGNWEGYTLGEHTETVLRVFERTYEGKIPEHITPIMKLILLVHDIGKPEAVAQGQKNKQHHHNAQVADQFLQTIGIEIPLRNIIKGIISEAQVHTTRHLVCGDQTAAQRLFTTCEKLLNENSPYPVTTNAVRGLMSMCNMLQTCDSAAYTNHAITRHSKEKYMYQNYPSFNESFNSPTGLTRRDVQMKNTDDYNIRSK